MTGKVSINDNRDKKITGKNTRSSAKNNQTQPTKTTPKPNKRDRSDLSPETTTKEPPNKTQIMSNPSETFTLADIKKLLGEQTTSIQQSIENEIKRMGDDIKAEFQVKITALNEKIEANHSNVQTQINAMKMDIENIKGQPNGGDDDLQRISKLNELKITGIAHANNENLNAIFGEIAKLVNFNLNGPNNAPAVNRIHKWDHERKTKIPTPIVIVKFVANHIRDDFYRCYMDKIAAKQIILPENIKLPAGKQIIIGENLTVNNSKIFIEASKLKRDKKLCQVFTQEGIVHVRAIKSEKATAIRSKIQLEQFIASRASNQQDKSDDKAVNGTTTTTETAAIATPTPPEQQNGHANDNDQNDMITE